MSSYDDLSIWLMLLGPPIVALLLAIMLEQQGKGK